MDDTNRLQHQHHAMSITRGSSHPSHKKVTCCQHQRFPGLPPLHLTPPASPDQTQTPSQRKINRSALTLPPTSHLPSRTPPLSSPLLSSALSLSALTHPLHKKERPSDNENPRKTKVRGGG